MKFGASTWLWTFPLDGSNLSVSHRIAAGLAGAVCIWRRFAESQDAFAEKGLRFLKRWYFGSRPAGSSSPARSPG